MLAIAAVGRALAPTGLVVTRPATPATDPEEDELLRAKAALKRAASMRTSALTLLHSAEVQVEQLRALVAKLEADRRQMQ